MTPLATVALAASDTVVEHSASTAVTALAIAVFVGAYVFIATEWVHRVVAALVGAALMVVIGAPTPTRRSSATTPASTGTSSSCCSG
jgi:hypothetical protein